MKKALKRGELPKKGGGGRLGHFGEGLLFLRGEKGLIPQCTLILLI